MLPFPYWYHRKVSSMFELDHHPLVFLTILNLNNESAFERRWKSAFGITPEVCCILWQKIDSGLWRVRSLLQSCPGTLNMIYHQKFLMPGKLFKLYSCSALKVEKFSMRKLMFPCVFVYYSIGVAIYFPAKSVKHVVNIYKVKLWYRPSFTQCCSHWFIHFNFLCNWISVIN